jgi:hypothetical protein
MPTTLGIARGPSLAKVVVVVDVVVPVVGVVVVVVAVLGPVLRASTTVACTGTDAGFLIV